MDVKEFFKEKEEEFTFCDPINIFEIKELEENSVSSILEHIIFGDKKWQIQKT